MDVIVVADDDAPDDADETFATTMRGRLGDDDDDRASRCDRDAETTDAIDAREAGVARYLLLEAAADDNIIILLCVVQCALLVLACSHRQSRAAGGRARSGSEGVREHEVWPASGWCLLGYLLAGQTRKCPCGS